MIVLCFLQQQLQAAASRLYDREHPHQSRPASTVTQTPGVPAVKQAAGGTKPGTSPERPPAPFAGVLAGFGAAAAVFGLRRK
ncbi:MAG TPA: hypothetical protein O0X84_04370 [Methanocorpusculum sp.]|nr:hypothetical protein [Methanocorpusculum sp.]